MAFFRKNQRVRLALIILPLVFSACDHAKDSSEESSVSSPATPKTLARGLLAQFSDSSRHVEVVVPTPHFYLAPEQSIHPALSSAFKAEWQGFLAVPESGRYRFRADGASLKLNGQEVGREPVELESGLGAIQLSYERVGQSDAESDARLELRWESDQFVEEPVPASALYHSSERGRDARLIERGRELFSDLGCIQCHVGAASSFPGRRGPALDKVGGRLAPAWIHAWLANPRAFRKDSVMPVITLGDSQRRDVTHYLSSLRAPGSEPGRTAAAPAADAVKKGEEQFTLLGCVACHSRDRLELDGLGSKMSREALKRYLLDPHSIDDGGGMPSFLLSEGDASLLAAYLGATGNPAFEVEFPDPGPGSVAESISRGRDLVRQSGCVNCHRLFRGRERIQSSLEAPGLDRLSTAGGCLAPNPPASLPGYTLSGEDRRALSRFIGFYRKHPDTTRAPVALARHRLGKLACARCHALDGETPSGDILDRAPPLDGVGAKLRGEWLRQVLLEKKHVRGKLRLRMPQYAPEEVTALIEELGALSGLGPKTDEDPLARLDAARLANHREAGMDLLGSDADRGGLSCIACHPFGDHRPVSDEQGPQLKESYRRLRFDWFRRWMHDPARIVSGTAMPMFFSEATREESDLCITELWSALSLGDRMPTPAGVGQAPGAPAHEILPTATASAAVIRRFKLPEVTSAAIAVGLPTPVGSTALSYCFEAADCQLRYAWQGGFVDFTDSFTKRQKRPKLVGEVFYRSRRFPFRIGDPDTRPTRSFKGYRIVDGIPEFFYDLETSIGPIHVQARIERGSDTRSLRLRYFVEPLHRPLYYIIEDSPDAVVEPVGVRAHDGQIEIPLGDSVQFSIQITPRRKEGK